ncbi:MAG: hypothetical protein KatS3mg027_0634 [Bacteroidia bacterium]|nr:MAG: hypothetical protein KatS3mg027_0634 [Bacteroidia bacterium]
MQKIIYNKQDFLVHKKNNNAFLEQLIENIYPYCNGIASRYAKTDEQANNHTKSCFLKTLKILLDREEEEFDNTTFLKQFTICVAKTILAERKGERIADTTIVSSYKKKDTNLFAASEYYKTLTPNDLIQHLRKLNTLQQLIYNLICIDQFSLSETAEILEHNELSIKALLEKAKYNLFTSIKSIV